MSGADFVAGVKDYLELCASGTLDLTDHHVLQEELAVEYRGLADRERIKVDVWIAALRKEKAYA